MAWVTRVAINASSLILFTIHALKIPTAAPTTRVIRTAGRNGIPQLISSAASTPDSAARDPGDRSFWPAMIR